MSDDVEDALARLETAFGIEPMTALITGFASLLGDALLCLDKGEERLIAHRVAGVAGTLGFVVVGRVWRAIEQGDSTMVDEARRQTHNALVFIAHRQNTVHPPTSV